MADFLKEHKALFIGGLALVIVLLTAGVSFVSSALSDQDEKEQVEEVDPDKRFDDAEEDETVRDLTKAQVKLQKDYSNKEKAIAQQLASTTWVGIDGAGTLEFDEDGFYTETVAGADDDEQSGSVAIAGIDTAPIFVAQDGSRETTDFIALDADGRHHIVHLQKIMPVNDEKFDAYYILKSDMFAAEDGYTTEYAWKELEFEGVGQELEDAIGKKGVKKLESQLQEYVKANHATCYKATWNSTILRDYATESASFSFMLTSSTLDDQGANETYQVNIDYSIDAKEFTITEISE